ncbi:unnamed protein product [Brassicogethes aeneus]|uniref:Large ribosomal subunit protein uL22 n=1 Tax=Brassicogethes aeneus TaxID=1431903 RepID=A0A9P0BKY6_BRAAE|nr:unnamed protein product [Brassicogethes aeneus]
MARGDSCHYSVKYNVGEVVRAKASNVPVHFKNTVEAARQLKGLSVQKAENYMKNVLARKVCVPFRRFKSGIGKCGQAKQFKTVVGRWPVKSIKALQMLLRNAVSNCDYFGKDPADFMIQHIQVNQAPVVTRRTYRAHGRINPFVRHLSHLQIILSEKVKL